ncbi:hypothetical protein ACFLS4_03530 [Bacteroidota bacterium]
MRKIKSGILANIILITTTTFIAAQSNFKPGYIITNNNEEIHGFIDLRGENYNCNKCVFKEDVNNESVTYLPGEIIAYRFIDGKYYISAFMPELEKDVFLEYLIDAIVDIYYYKELKNGYYFVNKQDSTLYRLIDDKKTVETEGVYVFSGIKTAKAEYAIKSNEYIGVLRYLFSDSKITMNKVGNVDLNHRSLIKIASDYHNEICSTEDCIVFEKQLPPVRFDFDIVVYSSYTGMEISHSLDYEGFDYKGNISYAFGLGTSIHPSRFSKNSSIYFQIIYGKDNFSANYIEEGLAGGFNYYYSDNEFSYLNNKLGFKYKFLDRKLQPEILFAYTYQYTLNSKAERLIEEEMSYGLRTNTYSDDILDVNYNGVSVGVGINVLTIKNTDFILNFQYDYLLYNLSGKSGIPTINLISTRIGLDVRF